MQVASADDGDVLAYARQREKAMAMKDSLAFIMAVG
jgi:predicted nucleic acid-binding Zn ribbon protein